MIDLTVSGIRTVYLLLIPETKDRSMEYVKTKTTKKRMGAKKNTVLRGFPPHLQLFRRGPMILDEMKNHGSGMSGQEFVTIQSSNGQLVVRQLSPGI